jgi:hypothetical protein
MTLYFLLSLNLLSLSPVENSEFVWVSVPGSENPWMNFPFFPYTLRAASPPPFWPRNLEDFWTGSKSPMETSVSEP